MDVHDIIEKFLKKLNLTKLVAQASILDELPLDAAESSARAGATAEERVVRDAALGDEHYAEAGSCEMREAARGILGLLRSGGGVDGTIRRGFVVPGGCQMRGVGGRSLEPSPGYCSCCCCGYLDCSVALHLKQDGGM